MSPKSILIPFTALACLLAAASSGCGGDDSTGATPTTTSSGTGGQGGSGGMQGVPADHLLISEIVVTPGSGEFIEIWNPTSSEIDLTDYYLSDNSVYFGIATGTPWTPQGTPGTDFLVRFPAGTKIAPDGLLVLASAPEYQVTYQSCPDFALTSDPILCNANPVPPMLEPPNGALGGLPGELLTNDGEMLMLFTWDEFPGRPVKDVDYLAWGSIGSSEGADKTNKEGYFPDTPIAEQQTATPPGLNESLTRCTTKEYETLTGGNGITGHDETSELMNQTFVISNAPTPRVKNSCL